MYGHFELKFIKIEESLQATLEVSRQSALEEQAQVNTAPPPEEAAGFGEIYP